MGVNLSVSQSSLRNKWRLTIWYGVVTYLMKEDRCVGQSESTLGVCPDCDVVIPSSNLLIKYETEDGWPQFFAECPRCEEPVHPG